MPVLSQISNRQGLGRNNKHDILKTDRSNPNINNHNNHNDNNDRRNVDNIAQLPLLQDVRQARASLLLAAVTIIHTSTVNY